nr:uncharacterized protein LOC126517978 [Dermacentor andersoni]
MCPTVGTPQTVTMRKVSTASAFLALVAAAQGYGWNPDRSRPVPSASDMDDCCRGPTGCCREGYRCEPNYRTCVRVGVEPRPGGTSKVLIVPVGTRRHQGTAVSGGTTGGCGGGGGHYCWDHERCCHISQSGAHLPTGVHPTTSCCTRSSSRQCPRIRGCHSPFGVNSPSGVYNQPGYRPSPAYQNPPAFNWDREQLMMQRHTLVPSPASALLPSCGGGVLLALGCFLFCRWS